MSHNEMFVISSRITYTATKSISKKVHTDVEILNAIQTKQLWQQ